METEKKTPIEAALRTLSVEGFAALGADQLAYIRRHRIKGQSIYVVHGADGRELASFDNYDSALGTCYQNDLEPVPLY